MGVPSTAGPFTNPGASTVLCDSGPITDNQHAVDITMASSAAALARIEHRNAANTATIWSQFLPVPANGTFHWQIERFLVTTADERIRLVLVNSVTGSVQASIVID